MHALGVVGYIQVGWVHSGTPSGSSDSFGRALGVVWFIGVRWVKSGATSGSSVFIRVRSVHSVAPCWSSGSFFFLGACSGSRQVHLGSLSSFGRVFGIVVFIRVRCIQSGAPWWSTGSFRFVWLIRAHPACCWEVPGVLRVHSCLLDSFVRALGVVGFVLVQWVNLGVPWGS